MAFWFWTIVLVLLVLTGAIIPVLIFAKWTLVAALVVALMGISVIGLLALLLKPFALIAADIFEAFGKAKRPAPDDPEYFAYLDWANRRGEYGRCRSWQEAKQLWLAKKNWTLAERDKWEREEAAWQDHLKGRRRHN